MSQTAKEADQEQQLLNLCAAQGGITAACIARSAIKYSSFESCRGPSLSDFQSFQCKLAQFCHNDIGGEPNTSLVCLAVDGGAEFLFTSNFRKQAQLEEMKRGLEELLRFAATNPDELKPKPLQKMILWRFIWFCFKRVDGYFKTLSRALDECIHECESVKESTITKQLYELKSRVEFPREITNTARNKILNDCETFIKAIEASKNSSLGGEIDRRARQDDDDQAYKWCELRHCLGRLYSYRQAAEAIVEATTKWPEIFKSFKVQYIPSADQKKAASPMSAKLTDVLHYAFPEYDLEEFQTDVAELQKYGLESEIRTQIFQRNTKTFIHAEVHMHDYLSRVRKVKATDFWDGTMFIATSKSVCRLCHFYFQNHDNEFSVQPPHMNLYPKWRLPDHASAEVLEDLIDKMQENTLNLITEKQPHYKRYDSRTDSQGCQTRATHRTVFDRSGAPSPLGGRSPQPGIRPGGYRNVPPPPSEVFDDIIPLGSAMEDYGAVGDGRASAQNGGSMIGQDVEERFQNYRCNSKPVRPRELPSSARPPGDRSDMATPSSTDVDSRRPNKRKRANETDGQDDKDVKRKCMKYEDSVCEQAREHQILTARMAINALTSTWSLGRNRRLDLKHVQTLCTIFAQGGLNRKAEENHLLVLCSRADVSRMMDHLQRQGQLESPGASSSEVPFFKDWLSVNRGRLVEIMAGQHPLKALEAYALSFVVLSPNCEEFPIISTTR